MKNENTPASGAEINADMDTETTEEAVPMRILLTGECFSLSQKSTLTYEVLCDQSDAIHFRVTQNSAAGLFSKDAVPMVSISNLVSGVDKINGATLQESVYPSQSRNSGAFLVAALVAESLLEKIPDQRGGYRTSDPMPFLKKIERLLATGPDDEPSDALTIGAPEVPKRGRPKKQLA
jgi:hypothetical protein